MRQSWCTRCENWKPIGDFSAKTRHGDGSPATVLSRCKPCLAEIKRLRRKTDPAWARMIDKQDWQRIKADPEKFARRQQLAKENRDVYRVRHAS